MASGRVVIPANSRHARLVPCGIGEGLQAKVNSNVGTSSDRAIPEEELEKLRVSIEAGADTVMDLSTGEDIDGSRKSILAESTVAIRTVPI
jgi:phosphomethylpyrimidine synthase